MNKAILMGRVTKDLEVKYSKDNIPILKFTIAVNRIKKGEADFINCLAFKERAENIAKYFSKGSMIAIEGKINTGSYDDKEGRKVYTTEVVIDAFHFTGEKKKGQTSQSTDEPKAGFISIESEELPF